MLIKHYLLLAGEKILRREGAAKMWKSSVSGKVDGM